MCNGTEGEIGNSRSEWDTVDVRYMYGTQGFFFRRWIFHRKDLREEVKYYHVHVIRKHNKDKEHVCINDTN